MIEVSDEAQWNALEQQIGEALSGFGDMSGRQQRAESLDAAIASWTAQRDARELMMQLQGAAIPAAATHSSRSILNDPHLERRGFWQWLERAVVGRQPNPSPPYRIGDAPFPIATPAPTLGQHDEEVLSGILGLGSNDLVRLTQLGIVGTRPRMPSKRRQDA